MEIRKRPPLAADSDKAGDNIIVVESARGHIEVGFWDYAKFEIPVTTITTMIGMLVLMLVG